MDYQYNRREEEEYVCSALEPYVAQGGEKQKYGDIAIPYSLGKGKINYQ